MHCVSPHSTPPETSTTHARRPLPPLPVKCEFQVAPRRNITPAVHSGIAKKMLLPSGQNSRICLLSKKCTSIVLVLLPKSWKAVFAHFY